MNKNVNTILSLLDKEFKSCQIKIRGINITLILKKSIKINLSVLEKEVLISPNNGKYFLLRSKKDDKILNSAVGRIKNILLVERINYAILHSIGSSK